MRAEYIIQTEEVATATWRMTEVLNKVLVLLCRRTSRIDRDAWSHRETRADPPADPTSMEHRYFFCLPICSINASPCANITFPGASMNSPCAIASSVHSASAKDGVQSRCCDDTLPCPMIFTSFLSREGP